MRGLPDGRALKFRVLLQRRSKHRFQGRGQSARPVTVPQLTNDTRQDLLRLALRSGNKSTEVIAQVRSLLQHFSSLAAHPFLLLVHAQRLLVIHSRFSLLLLGLLGLGRSGEMHSRKVLRFLLGCLLLLVQVHQTLLRFLRCSAGFAQGIPSRLQGALQCLRNPVHNLVLDRMTIFLVRTQCHRRNRLQQTQLFVFQARRLNHFHHSLPARGLIRSHPLGSYTGGGARALHDGL
mmetsp:Transcript_20964/g.51447  ORF Transcript_20964/g.51447 Transcript_20964/m.51447 type:complete len:234 (-) Transcript_20964:50-751(-)